MLISTIFERSKLNILISTQKTHENLILLSTGKCTADNETTEWAVTPSKGKRRWSNFWITLPGCHLSTVNIITYMTYLIVHDFAWFNYWDKKLRTLAGKWIDVKK